MTLSSLLFSDGGAGKSYVLATAPGPIIIAETEGRSHLLPRKTTQWDPKTGKYPTDLTKDSITVVPIGSLQDMNDFMLAVSSPESPWVTIAIDSFTVLVRICETSLVNEAKDMRQEYKKLFTHLEQTVLIPLKNVISRADTKAEVLVLTAWKEAESVRPFMTGAIKGSVNHLFDMVAHVEITFADGKIGNTARIMPTRQAVVKAPGQFYYKYGESIVNPDLSVLNELLAKKD